MTESEEKKRRRRLMTLKTFELSLSAGELDKLFDETHKLVLQEYERKGFKLIRDIKIAPFLWRTELISPEGTHVSTDVQLYVELEKKRGDKVPIRISTPELEFVSPEERKLLLHDAEWRYVFGKVPYTDERDLETKLETIIRELMKRPTLREITR